MPGPQDIRKFVPGQPLQDYLSQSHLNAVLEAVRIIGSRSSSDSGGAHRAIGHLRANAPGVINRDVVFAKNISHNVYLDTDDIPQWAADRFYHIRKFQTAVIYPPEEIRSDKSASDDFSEGKSIFTAFTYYPGTSGTSAGGVGQYPSIGTEPDNQPTIAIALHDVPECSIGLFLLSGVSSVFSGRSYDTRSGGEYEAIYDAPYQVSGAFRNEFPDASIGDTLSGGGGTCHYDCVEDGILSITGYRWKSNLGSCGPNSQCPDLGNCNSPGISTQAPCELNGSWFGLADVSSPGESRSIATSRVDSFPARWSYDGLAVCTDIFGEWSWYHIGNNCADGVLRTVTEYNLPECTEDLCGKLRPSLCEQLPDPPTTTTSTTTSTTTACPPPSTDGECYAECGYDSIHQVWRFMIQGDPLLSVNDACTGVDNGCNFCCLYGGKSLGCGLAPENAWCGPYSEGHRIPGRCIKPAP